MNIKYLMVDPDLLRRAQQGDVNAQFNLAVAFYEGNGVPQDYLEAAKWYGMAADKGDAQAQFNLGLMFYQAKGLPRDYRHAYELFRLAAAQGDERARMGMESILGEVDETLRAELVASGAPQGKAH